MTQNTLLARMGFRDPDRRSEVHDRVCRAWFAEPGRLLREAVAVPLEARAFSAEIEFPVKAHRGGAVVGFLDALVTLSDPGCHPDFDAPGEGAPLTVREGVLLSMDRVRAEDAVGRRHRGVSADRRRVLEGWGGGYLQRHADCLHTALVEVKSGAVDLGAWLRQLRMYGDAVPADYRVLSSVRPIDDGDRRIFASIGWSVHDAASHAG